MNIKDAKTVGELRKMINGLPDSYSLVEGLSLKDALLHKTAVGEFCIILDSGYPVGSAYIDSEDLFTINDSLANRKVIKDEYGMWEINSNDSNDDRTINTMMVPCHKFHIGDKIV